MTALFKPVRVISNLIAMRNILMLLLLVLIRAVHTHVLVGRPIDADFNDLFLHSSGSLAANLPYGRENLASSSTDAVTI